MRRPPNIIHAIYNMFIANHFMHVYNFPDCHGTCTLSSLNAKYHLFYKLFASEIQFVCSIETCTHILLIVLDIVLNHLRLHLYMSDCFYRPKRQRKKRMDTMIMKMILRLEDTVLLLFTNNHDTIFFI